MTLASVAWSMVTRLQALTASTVVRTAPSGEMKNDPYFGLIEVYKSPVVAEIVLERAPKGKALTLYASYQGCNEKLGICYPPIEKTVDLKFD